MTLVRFTYGVVSARDLVLELIGLAVVGVIPVLLLDRPEPDARRELALRVATIAPALLVGAAIALPSLTRVSAPATLAGLVVVLAPVAAWVVERRRRGADPVPAPLMVATYLFGVTVVSWLLEHAALPLMAVWPAAVIWYLLCFASRKPMYLPLPLVMGAAMAQYPDPGLPGQWGERAAGSGPDLVLITVDTLRADAELDVVERLAEEGRRFTTAWSPSTWTLPALASLHTGLEVPEHGAGKAADGSRRGIRADVTVLAEALGNAGWDTAAVVAANVNASEKYGFSRGFDTFYSGLEALEFARPGPVFGIPGTARPLFVQLGVWLGLEDRRPIWDAPEITRRALRVVSTRRSGRPLFLWVHYMDPHLPYLHAREVALPGWRQDDLLHPTGGHLTEAAYWTDEEGREAQRRGYANEVARVDRAVETLLNGLGSAPEGGRVVAFTSDHGEELFEHGTRGHGHAFWEEVLRVPLVISGTGVVPSVTDMPVSLVDLAPTFLAAAGVPSRVDLRSDAQREAVIRAAGLMRGVESSEARAARGSQWKWVTHPARAMFDLTADPSEQSPLPVSPQGAAVLDGRGIAAETSEEPSLSPTESELLHDLGYLD